MGFVVRKDKCMYTMSIPMIVILTCFYTVLLMGGMYIAARIMTREEVCNYIMKCTVYASLATCSITSSMSAIQKIYCACIQSRIKFKMTTKADKMVAVGHFLYFLFTPLFGFGLVILFIFLVRSGLVMIMSGDSLIVSEKFLCVSAVIGAMIGDSVSSALQYLDKYSRKMLDKLIKVELDEEIEKPNKKIKS